MIEHLIPHAAMDGYPQQFKHSPNQRATGLTFRGLIRVAPRHLTERSGPPSGATGDGKASGTYVFEDDRGSTLAIYDWKSTALYNRHPAANLPTVHAFWACGESAEFSLAVRGSVDLVEFARPI